MDHLHLCSRLTGSLNMVTSSSEELEVSVVSAVVKDQSRNVAYLSAGDGDCFYRCEVACPIDDPICISDNI